MGSRHTKVTAEDRKKFALNDKATLLYCQSYAPITDPNGNVPECPDQYFHLRQNNGLQKVKSETGINRGNFIAGMQGGKEEVSTIYGVVFGQPLPQFVYEVPEGCIPTTLKTSLLDEYNQQHLVTTVSYNYQKMNMPENQKVEEAGQVKDELNSQDSMPTNPKEPDHEAPKSFTKKGFFKIKIKSN